MAVRVLAFLFAVAMVVASFVVRARLDRDSDGGSGTDADGALRLTCSTELAEACQALGADEGNLEVAVEPAGVTADRLKAATGGDLDLDGWLAPGPWPQMVRDDRARRSLDQLLAPPGEPLARSPLVLVVWRDRAEVLRRWCQDDDLGWRCLGEAAPKRWEELGGDPLWGPVKPALADPTVEAEGLAVLGAATVAIRGTTDMSSDELTDDDSFRAWLSGLARAVPRTLHPSLEDMLAAGPSLLDVLATVEARAGPSLATTARSDKPLLIYPSPVSTVDVTLGVPTGSDRAERLAELVRGRRGRQALARAGWRVEGQPRVRGVPANPPLPSASGLPSPGVLDFLRDTWRSDAG